MSVEELDAALGSLPPRGFRDLPDQQQAKLARMLRDASERHASALEQALVKSVRYLPPGVKAIARRLLEL